VVPGLWACHGCCWSSDAAAAAAFGPADGSSLLRTRTPTIVSWRLLLSLRFFVLFTVTGLLLRALLDVFSSERKVGFFSLSSNFQGINFPGIPT